MPIRRSTSTASSASSRGARVIGVTFADEQRRTVYFDPTFAGAGALARPRHPESAADRLRRVQRRRQPAAVHAGSDTDPGRYYRLRQDRRGASTRSCWPAAARECAASRRVRPVTYPAADGTQVPAYLTLPPGQRRPQPAGDRPAAWRPGGARRMGLRLARPISRPSRLCRAPAQLSAARPAMATHWLQQNGFQRLADVDRRHQRRRALAGRAGHRRSEPDGDRRLVLWRLCGAAVGRDRAGPVQGDRRDRAGHRPAAAQGRLPRLSPTPRNVAEYIGTGPHIARRLAAAERRARSPRRCCCSTATATSTSPSSTRGGWTARCATPASQSELVVFPGLEHDLADSEARRRMLDQIRGFLAGRLGQPGAQASAVAQ